MKDRRARVTRAGRFMPQQSALRRHGSRSEFALVSSTKAKAMSEVKMARASSPSFRDRLDVVSVNLESKSR
jgi:hypothetical protein